MTTTRNADGTYSATSPNGTEFIIRKHGSRWNVIAAETIQYRYHFVAQEGYGFTSKAKAETYVKFIADKPSERWVERIADAHAAANRPLAY